MAMNRSKSAKVWITDRVELPQAVLDAHVENNLVFFVGAGVSVDSPSDLPLFRDLARQLADMAKVSFSEEMELDLFLGSMPAGFDTHRHARDIIAHATSLPNRTHAALVRLASAGGSLRIVTTNFDDHLAAAAVAEGIKVSDKWVGPALPLGADVDGIAHLHGSVFRQPEQLVLTDRDFGMAYLTNAWATRFLLPIFDRFTVLFVGYSHDDPIMRYLSLGLPSVTRRYVLVEEKYADDPKWTRLGVQPISYPVQDNDHGALVAALEAWNVRARMGQTEHRARTKQILSSGPILTPLDHDYLVGRLRTAEGAHDFAQEVDGLDLRRRLTWLRWIETLPEFKALFSDGERGPSTQVLTGWFCACIESPELNGAALQTVQRLGTKFNGDLYLGACCASGQLQRRDPRAGQQWRALLASSIEGHSAAGSTHLLGRSESGASQEHRAVIRSALRPRLVLRAPLSAAQGDEALTVTPRAELSWSVDADDLRQHLVQFALSAEPGDPSLGSLLENALSEAYDLLEAYTGPRQWDFLSFQRMAIEPHEQDRFGDSVHAIIDGLRSFGERALGTGPELPERWWRLGRSLFRRLALHLVASDASRSSEDKLAWLLDRASLFDTALKHEVYAVLAASVADASLDLRSRLLTAALEGPQLREDHPDRARQRAYSIYNLLVWLTRSAPDWRDANAALAELQSANDFEPRAHPDFDRWITSGTWGNPSSIEPEAFVLAVEDNAEAALDALLRQDFSGRSLGRHEWEDQLSSISQAVASRPTIGESLWRAIEGRSLNGRGGQLRRAVMEGWADVDLADSQDAVLGRVMEEVSDPESAVAIGDFLLKQIRRQVDAIDSAALAAMRRIAAALWRQHAGSFSHRDDVEDSYALLYLNSWPGDLAIYWITEIDRRWRASLDDWSGLDDEERGALTQFLRGDGQALDATRPAVASQLYFMFAADARFTVDEVLPLFRNETTAAQVWRAFLYQPRYDDKLLGEGFLECVIAEFDRLTELGSRELQTQFFGVVTAILSFAGINTTDSQRLLTQTVVAGDGAYASSFAETVVRFLNEFDVNGAEVYDRWLHDHITARLGGLPRDASTDELAWWADSVPALGDAVPQAIEQLRDRGVAFGDHFIGSTLADEVLSRYGDQLIGYYTERTLHTPAGSPLIRRQIQRLVRTLRAALGEDRCRPLINVARDQGFLDGGEIG